MGSTKRSEYILGLIVPLAVLVLLVIVGLTRGNPAVAVAFMAAVPMFAAMFSRALFTGIVALASVVGGVIVAANGSDTMAASVESICTAAEWKAEGAADALIDACTSALPAANVPSFMAFIPVLLGVIIGAGAAVLASQAKGAGISRPRPAPAAGPASAAPAQAADATVDDLTGLPTRAGALTALRESTAAGPRVVAVIDCDHLANLNETHGRAVGDTFIFAVAGRTRYALPDEDLVVRWDGEEFVVVATGDTGSTRQLMELITDKVNKNPIRTDAGLLPQSMSVGAADWPPGGSFDDALARARHALYQAKADGGARLVIEPRA